MSRSCRPDSSSSGSGCALDLEWLDVDELPIATGAVAEALERNRPGPMTLEESARFVRSFRWSADQRRAIPTAEALLRFTLGD